jgi:hypothetical protein
MTETCHAAVFNGDGTYDVRTFPVPDPPAGEMFGLDGIAEALALLTRTDPGRDAVRVGLAHTSPGR